MYMKHYSKLKETKISTTTLYKGVLGVKLDEVRLVNGHTSTRLYFDHRGASAVLPLEGDAVYLVQQYRYPVRKTTWEIPAGKREKGQTFLTCAKAELQQETGLRAKTLKEVMMFHPSNAFSNEELHLFVATGLHRGKDAPDEDEFINLRKFPIEKAFQMVEKGQINDAKTIIMLQWLELHPRK
jgi:ADP-ribose pyrophosphatase